MIAYSDRLCSKGWKKRPASEKCNMNQAGTYDKPFLQWHPQKQFTEGVTTAPRPLADSGNEFGRTVLGRTGVAEVFADI